MVKLQVARLLGQLGPKTLIPFEYYLTAGNEHSAAMTTQPIANRANRFSWLVAMSANILPGYI
jgi:hypothetical protein